MPSTREGSPTPPGSKSGNDSYEDAVKLEKSGYALPSGMLSSNNSIAVTSASPSENGAFSTPARGRYRDNYFQGANDFDPPPSFNPYQSPQGPVPRLERDLEAGYEVQSNNRMQRFLVQFPGGAPDHEIERFKQKEAIERTKFVCFKDSELAKLIKGLSGVRHDPYFNNSATPTAQHRYQSTDHMAHFRTGGGGDALTRIRTTIANPFQVNSIFPPPPSNNHISVNSNFRSDQSFVSHTMSSSNSGAPEVAGSVETGANGGSDGELSTNDPQTSRITKVETMLDRDQIVAAFSATWEKIEAVNATNAQLRGEVSELKEIVIAFTQHSDLAKLVQRVELIERQLRTVTNGQPLESDAALVTELQAQVSMLYEKINLANNEFLSRRAFHTENELTKMTFNNKCGLIERYLGIDITTTGPKPHDVLEALHARIWHLEGFLGLDDPAFKSPAQYRPLNDFMKITLGRNNSMVSYSATPGFNHGAFGDTSSMRGSIPASNTAGLVSYGHFGANPIPALPATGVEGLAQLQDHLAGMNFDPVDYRFNRANSVSNPPPKHFRESVNFTRPVESATFDGGAVQSSQPELPRRLSGTNLIPVGVPAPGNLKSPPRRSRASSSRTSFSVTSPKRRSMTGAHSRNGSETTTKVSELDATAGAFAPPAKETKERAYTSWLNQRPGDFLGKKLSGLGQKD